MNRTTLTLSVLALGLGSIACNKTESPAEERAEARQELGKALDEHREAVREADEELQGDRAKEVAGANEELANKHNEAYEEVADADEEARDELDRDDDKIVDRSKPESARDPVEERFEAYKDETKHQFQSRAQARIAALEQEIQTIEVRNPDAHAREEFVDARNSLAEAKKDLNEVVKGTEDVFDDGKAGVAISINNARRKVDRVKDDINDPK